VQIAPSVIPVDGQEGVHCDDQPDPTLHTFPASGHWPGRQVSEPQLHAGVVQTASVRQAGLGLSSYVHGTFALQGPPLGGDVGHSVAGTPPPSPPPPLASLPPLLASLPFAPSTPAPPS
jgi:hypothetical protein